MTPPSSFRLLHIIPDLDPRSGGTVSALVGLAIAQSRKLGWNVSVVTCATQTTDHRAIDQLRESGVAVPVLPVPKRFLPGKEFRERIAELIGNSDLVHVHAVWEELQHVACRTAAKMNVPYIVSPHGMLDPWSLAKGRLKKSLYLRLRLKKDLDRALFIHCTTMQEMSLIADLEIKSPKRVIPNGIDLSEFREVEDRGQEPGSREWFYEKYPHARGRPVVAFLSRLHPKKGLDLLLPSFAQLKSEDALLVLAGPGNEAYVNDLKQKCKKLDIDHRVVFTGMLQGAQRISVLRIADVFVLPSYQENFGIAVAESLAAGTPVVISDQVNFSEYLQGVEFAAVVRLENSLVSNAISSFLMPSEEESAKRSSAAKAFANSFSFDVVAEKWSDSLAASNHKST